ncbi:hypothetical protein ACFOUV_08680 [Oceanobacillus longus]|uniref:Uncharacterized protein n=1 Tax=Oceanobacillus longus TaxID=930120 RepID=A0ABV8H0R0_9BACI
MIEQEKYKNMLRRMIDETEKQNIHSSEELIKMLINELSSSKRLEKYAQYMTK